MKLIPNWVRHVFSTAPRSIQAEAELRRILEDQERRQREAREALRYYHQRAKRH